MNKNEIIINEDSSKVDPKEEAIDSILKEPAVPTDETHFTVVSNNKKRKIIFIVVISLIFLALLILSLSTSFALFHMNSDKIISGISINNIDVSGLTVEEAKKKISEYIQSKMVNPITLKRGEFESTVFAEQFEVTFDIDNAVQTAFSKGRRSNIFVNNLEIVNALFGKVNIYPAFSYNNETLLSLIREFNTTIPDRLVEPSYYVEGNNLILTKGIDGVVINEEDLKKNIIYLINNMNVNDYTIEIPVIQKTAGSLDMDKIHSEIYKNAQDAYYTTNPYVVHPDVPGIDFNISLEEAKALLENSTDTCTIPLKVIKPKVTTEQIGQEAFPDLLATFSTSYSSSNSNRTTNIILATNKINGTVIMPGETFSYNQIVGQRTAAAGFKSATVYSGGEVTSGIGGGICQVSTTLYNVVLLANLEIVERYNHGFQVGYVKASTDATVSWGGPDFKFKNNRDYPIRIVCSNSGGKNIFKIFGLKSDNDYEVVIESSVIQSIPYKTVYQNNSSMAKGTQKVIQNGSNGCKSKAYKVLKKNGQVISRTLLSTDTYNPHNKIIAVGTK